MESRRTFLGLGSNVEDRLEYIFKAIELLRDAVCVVGISTVYESEPWGVPDQPTFLNCVLMAETRLEPIELLKIVKDIEKRVGRKERFRWGPREIDIDILLYGDKVVDLPDLKIPHPYLKERDFFLIPLLELDQDVCDPKTREPYRKALNRLSSKLKPFCSILPST